MAVAVPGDSVPAGAVEHRVISEQRDRGVELPPVEGRVQLADESWVKSPNATPAQLEELCQYVQDTSPVRDCLANPVPVMTDLVVLD